MTPQSPHPPPLLRNRSNNATSTNKCNMILFNVCITTAINLLSLGELFNGMEPPPGGVQPPNHPLQICAVFPLRTDQCAMEMRKRHNTLMATAEDHNPYSWPHMTEAQTEDTMAPRTHLPDQDSIKPPTYPYTLHTIRMSNAPDTNKLPSPPYL